MNDHIRPDDPNASASERPPLTPAASTLKPRRRRPPRPAHPTIFHHVSLVAFLAWVGLGADGLSSSCYGPEEAFLALGDQHFLALFLASPAVTVFVISASYSQIIELFPTGGGGYLVATLLLGPCPAWSRAARCSSTTC